MKRGIIIIPTEEMNLEILEEEFTGKEQRHAMYMKKALEQMEIKPEIEGFSPFEWGKSCSEAGLITLSIDDFNILFLPEIIDKKQYDWFYKNSKMISELKRLNLIYYYRDQIGFLHLLMNQEQEDVLIFQEVKTQIEEKYKLYQKIKKEGVKVCTKILK